ncbi:hypothetical protein FRC01_013966, partial [Tulasnella sp. 417]
QWLERNRSCPYCRKNISRRPGRRGASTIGRRPRPGPPPPPGPSSSSTSWASYGSYGPDASWGAPDRAR